MLHRLIKGNLLVGLLPVLLSISSYGVMASVNPYDETIIHPPIPLLDEQGNHVLQTNKEFSSKTSCGTSGCHDYDAITHAYHMEMGRDEADDNYGKTRGVPQLVAPGYYGGYNCMGGSRPKLLSKKFTSGINDFADYGSPGFVRDCSTCHSGGGFAEKDRQGIRYDEKDLTQILPFDSDYYERMSNTLPSAGGHGGHRDDGVDHSEHLVLFDWKKSGVVENDCMLCHADFNALKKFPASGSAMGANDASDGSDNPLTFYTSARSSVIIGNNFFRYSTTPIWEYYDLKPDTEEGLQLMYFEKTFREGQEGKAQGYDLNLDANGLPIVHWNRDAFDENGKAHIPMLRFPGNDNCMQCHRTSNSRRGFYGFGDNALADFDDDGVIEPDYQDDVHKGKVFVANNGEERAIENCNTCHARNYTNPPFANVDLNVDHNFLKGNSDMDVRNDLDYDPNAKSCEYCHDDMKNNVVPSGQANMLDAHRELWKANGDMAGYEKDQLSKITKTHLDVVACQACHITGKSSRGNPLQIMYRYRQAEEGVSKIFPYNPKMRYFWKNKNGDQVLSRHDNDSILEVKTDSEGNQYGAIVDPITHEELGKVSFRMGRHGPSYGSPEDYETFVAMKSAYDKLMQKKGVMNADMQQVWIESNEYVMSHNVRPSSSSVPCGDCHSRKQGGAFSSLISADGIMGSAVVKTVTELPDKRLVDEGLVVLGMDYFKVNEEGVVTQNVEDILYSTKINAFMTYLKNSSAFEHEAEFKRSTLADSMQEIGMIDDAVRQSIAATMGGQSVYLLNTHQGNDVLKGTSMVGFAGGMADILLPTYRIKSRVINHIPPSIVSLLEGFVPGGKVASSIHYFMATDPNRVPVPDLLQKVYIKLPYRGLATQTGQLRIVYSTDGSELFTIDPEDVVLLNPHTEESDGYVIFTTDKLRYFAIMDVL